MRNATPHNPTNHDIRDSQDNQRGTFLVVEGPNCTGKSTLLHVVADAVQNTLGGTVECFQDPYSAEPTPWKKALLTARKDPNVSQKHLASLYALTRYDLWRQIKGELLAGNHVVCGRWVYSTLAFQPLCHDLTRKLHDLYDIGFPDGVLLLDVSWKKFLERRATRIKRNRPKKTDELTSAEFTRIRSSYLSLREQASTPVAALDTSDLRLDEVEARIPAEVYSLLKRLYPDLLLPWEGQQTSDQTEEVA